MNDATEWKIATRTLCGEWSKTEFEVPSEGDILYARLRNEIARADKAERRVESVESILRDATERGRDAIRALLAIRRTAEALRDSKKRDRERERDLVARINEALRLWPEASVAAEEER